MRVFAEQVFGLPIGREFWRCGSEGGGLKISTTQVNT
jgi:hypothetical protein